RAARLKHEDRNVEPCLTQQRQNARQMHLGTADIESRRDDQNSRRGHGRVTARFSEVPKRRGAASAINFLAHRLHRSNRKTHGCPARRRSSAGPATIRSPQLWTSASSAGRAASRPPHPRQTVSCAANRKTTTRPAGAETLVVRWRRGEPGPPRIEADGRDRRNDGFARRRVPSESSTAEAVTSDTCR